MTILGSLTTAVALKDCRSTLSMDSNDGQWATEAVWGLGPSTTPISSCYPSGFNWDGYYTPGICPSGWTSACSASRGRFGYGVSETGVQCCPDGGYSCTDNNAYCVATLQPSPTGPATTVILGDQSSVVTTFQTALKIFGVPIIAVYQSTDAFAVEYFRSTPATATGTTSGTHSALATGSGVNSSGGLSTGTKAAIGVVVPLVVIGIATLSWFILRLRRRRSQKSAEKPKQSDTIANVVGSDKPELPAGNVVAGKNIPWTKPELAATKIEPPEAPNSGTLYELLAQNHPSEVPSRAPAVEQSTGTPPTELSARVDPTELPAISSWHNPAELDSQDRHPNG